MNWKFSIFHPEPLMVLMCNQPVKIRLVISDSSYQVNIIHIFMLFTEVTNLDFALNFFLLAVDVALPLERDLPLVEEDLE